MEQICEECEIELNNFEDVIFESHTKRCYCRNCGAYVGDINFIYSEDKNGIPNSIISMN